MKKILVLLVFTFLLSYKGFSQSEPTEHAMIIHGWVFDVFSGNPVSHHWVYFKSNNNNAHPSKDSALTNNSGHYHIDSIMCENNSWLDIELYTYDCQGGKHSYHISWYDVYKTLNFTLCAGPLPFCKAKWQYESNPTNELQVLFQDHSEGNINSWFWDFGDGMNSMQKNPTHTYTNAGTYEVILQVMDTISNPPCIDVDTQYVTVVATNYFNLAGQVFAGFFPHPQGIANLWFLTSKGFMFLDSCQLNNNGVYVFYQIPEGNYFITISKVSEGNPAVKYWPTYFSNQTTWVNSQMLNLQADNFQADINLQTFNPSSYGPGKIGGKALSIHHGNTTEAADVEIMLADDMGKYLNYVYSDEHGNYEFPQLPYGTYHLHAEIPGLSTSEIIITLDANQPEITDADIITSNPVTGLDENNIQTETGQVYPNPNKGQAQIDIISKNTADYTLLISDILGVQKIKTCIKLQAGKNTLDLPLYNLYSGTYFLILSNNSTNIIRKKFEIIR